MKKDSKYGCLKAVGYMALYFVFAFIGYQIGLNKMIGEKKSRCDIL